LGLVTLGTIYLRDSYLDCRQCTRAHSGSTSETGGSLVGTILIRIRNPGNLRLPGHITTSLYASPTILPQCQ